MAGKSPVVLMLNGPDELRTNIVLILDVRLFRTKEWEESNVITWGVPILTPGENGIREYPSLPKGAHLSSGFPLH